MKLLHHLLVLFMLFGECGSLTRYISHIQNYVNLVSSYNLDGFSTVDFPPLADVSQALEVIVNIHLYAVNGFDEVAGNIELVVALDMSWLDEMSVIQSIQFKIEDRSEFLVPYDQIWTPKLVLTNAIGETSDVGDSAYLCRFDMVTKRVSWKPRVVVSGSCTPDVTFYPFDKQECDFVYTAWGFRSNEIMITSSTNAWNMDEYGESGEWTIDSTSTESYVQNEQSYIKFKLVMVRKPLYFAFNILLPILVLCLLNSTVFLLPAESGERVGFSVTCFLSFMVLLNMIMDIMPRSSNPISFLCYYLVVMMSNSGAMTLVTILLMRVYHKPEKSQVPKWMQRAVTFVNCGCARIRCCVLCCRYIRDKCCCDDQRKCGCNKRRGHVDIDESLSEISIDSEQNIVEKPVGKKAKVSPDEYNTDVSDSKCCIMPCFKTGKSSKSNNDSKEAIKEKELLEEQTHSDKSEKDISSSCTDFFRIRKRKNNDEISPKTNEINEIKKAKKEEVERSNNSSPKCCTLGWSALLRTSSTEKNETNEKANTSNGASDAQTKLSGDIESENIEVTSKHFSCLKSNQNSNTDKSGESSARCFPYCREEKTEKGDVNHKCYDFFRRKKIASVSSLDVVDIDNSKLPTTVRSKDSKTLKVSFKGHDKLDTQETILQRWENATQDTTNKKKSSLNPIQGNPNTEENAKGVEFDETRPGEVTLRTKSIRASEKEKEMVKRVIIKPSDGDFEHGNEFVKDKITDRKGTVTAKENLPKTIGNDSDVPLAQRRKSTVSLLGKEKDKEFQRQSMMPVVDDTCSDKDSLDDLEEEVSWPEVGRILDTFFFLAFAGGQAFLTVVFLVPLFTGDNKSSES